MSVIRRDRRRRITTGRSVPRPLTWESRTPERALVELYRPGFLRLSRMLGFFTRLQEGQVMVYLRYLAVALLVLLAWLFWPVGASR